MNRSLIVQNLKCGGCVNTITSKISEIENISNVAVDKETSSVSYTCENSEDEIKVKEKLRKLGYPSVDENNSMISKASAFVSCATGKIK